jgi:transcriptional regulator GlxA family with amidase domain
MTSNTDSTLLIYPTEHMLVKAYTGDFFRELSPPSRQALSRMIGNMHHLQIGMVLFPQLTQLDLTGPFEVLSRLSETRVLLLWKSLEAITSDTGMSILPTSTFSECPQLDVVFVPGGPGQVALMEDDDVLGFLRHQAREAMYVTSV